MDGGTRLDITSILKTRRTIHDFKSDPIPESVLNDILSLAPWVPNHHLTEPWHFYVIQGQSLKKLADLRYDAVFKKNAGKPQQVRVAEKAKQDFLQVPVVIAVVQRLHEDPKRSEEDYVAVNLALYNILLAAWDRGIGSYWGTGPLTEYEPLRQWLSLAEQERIVGFIRLGYAEVTPDVNRTPVEQRSTWLR